MSQAVNCSYIIHINELVGLEVPMHACTNGDFDVLIILHKL